MNIFQILTQEEYFLYLVVVPLAMISLQLCGIVDWLKMKLYYLKYTRQTKYRPYVLKPLDCPLCLSFWFVLLHSHGSIFTALAAYALCYVYNRAIERV